MFPGLLDLRSLLPVSGSSSRSSRLPLGVLETVEHCGAVVVTLDLYSEGSWFELRSVRMSLFKLGFSRGNKLSA